MKITILCSSDEHPVNSWIEKWINSHSNNHSIDLFRSKKELKGGDVLFLISCSEIITNQERRLFNKTLVIHASDLPEGRGWSPHIWDILQGKNEITLSLLEAEDKVDSGDIWAKRKVFIEKTDLYNEINAKIFEAELELMSFGVVHFDNVKPIKQDHSVIPTYHPKRSSKDSELDIRKSLETQFNLIRVCDPKRFPAFFYYNNQKYNLYIEKAREE